MQNEQRWQQMVIVFSLPIFAILSVHKCEARNQMLVEDKGVCIQLQHMNLQLSPVEIGNTCSSGGPLRVLGFIARAAKSTRRKDDAAESRHNRSTQHVITRQMITRPV